MPNITIAAPTTSMASVTITVPGGVTPLDTYLNVNRGLAVSIPVAVNGTTNFTSMGRYLSGATNSVWRLRNQTSVDLTSTLSSQGIPPVFSAGYYLPSGADTFAVSTVYPGTHFATNLSNSPKAAGPQTFSYGYVIGTSGNSNLNTYTVIGGGGDDDLTGGSRNDTIIGGAGNDTLTGLGGADTLTGGLGDDTFKFTNQFADTVTDFSVSGANGIDVFAIESSSYIGYTPASPSVGNAAGAGADNYIIVDTLTAIQGVTSSNTYFAYDTTNSKLLFDVDGNWSSGSTTIATTNLVAGLTASNFAFV